MENFSTILQTVWRPAQKKLMGGVASTPPDRARVNPPFAGGGGVKRPPLLPPSYNSGLARRNRAKLRVAVKN